ncbi:MAG: hypothetical protein ACI8RZ_006958 [Myxococcota bacterium]|jgi:hypothetical protein
MVIVLLESASIGFGHQSCRPLLVDSLYERMSARSGGVGGEAPVSDKNAPVGPDTVRPGDWCPDSGCQETIDMACALEDTGREEVESGA